MKDKLLKSIERAEELLKETDEWQRWIKTLDPKDLNAMQNTIEWRSQSLLKRAYDARYGEAEFKQGEDRLCEDCMQDRDSCPDCCDGDLYRSPDAYEVFGMER